MKYKVGDKVRIVSEWRNYRYVNSCGYMDKYLGKTMTIQKCDGAHYKMKEDQGDEYKQDGWAWYDEHIAGLVEFTKADLQNGDVILRRNGDVEIYNASLGMFIARYGWNDADEITAHLLSDDGKEFDIIAVRRPCGKEDCCFAAFTYKYGDLVYERKEPEEMTLEEVCRLLGKEIKIVKSK